MKPLCNSVKNRYGGPFSVTLCLLIFSAISAQAQNSPSGGWGAIVIGISQYKEVTPLQFADRDAIAFAEFLKTQQVPEDNIKLFLNENATRFNIVDELYNTSQSLQKGDRFYFYFGGHGDLEARIGYENSLLLLYNSFKTGYFQGNEYLQLSELKTWFDELTKKGVEVVFIADACHSGGLIGGKEGLTKTQRALQESWGGITKILSCKSDEFSLEGKQWGGGRGIFSYHLVNGLTGLADANKDKKVTLSELNKYLSVNVLREADPNIQTPVVQGNNKQLLAKTDDASLKKLREDLMRSVPTITEVNIKAKETQLLEGMDRTLTETYEKFKKALNENRINTFDNEKDYALLHYRKLVAAKIPDLLLQSIKRKMGEGLLRRELELMKDAREKGRGFVVRLEKVVTPALRNLEEAMKLFGPDHYIYTPLKARSLVLESRNWTPQNFEKNQSIDKTLQDIDTYYRSAYEKEKTLLLKSLELEPIMISTYALLASVYRDGEKKDLDSSIYYQEKVVELLPNQGYAHLNLATTYASMKYTDANNKPAIHPKAILHFEKTIDLEPTLREPYRRLGSLYMGESNLYRGDSIHTYYHDYAKAIPYYEKLLGFSEEEEKRFLEKGRENYLKAINAADFSLIKNNFAEILNHHSTLRFLHVSIADTTKAAEYFDKTNQKVNAYNSVVGYMNAAFNCYRLFGYTEQKVYLKNALDLQQRAFKKAGEDLKVASTEEKPLLTLKYRELIKGLGAVHRALKHYTEAENYLQQALVYPVPDEFKGKLKLTGSVSMNFQNLFVTYPSGIQKIPNGDYHYRIDANEEMFYLKFEQGKTDEAFEWLEKAFQQSVIEYGNDVSGKPWEGALFDTYKNLDQVRFKALKAKYFPPTEKK